MLYITRGNTEGVEDVSWHVGEPVNMSLADVRLVTEIQADEDELTFIRSRMINLPHAEAKVDRWYGDQAKQIAFMLLTRHYDSRILKRVT